MKLIIQIPCRNEEKTLPGTLREIPKSIPGISRIEIQIIDDGSTDRTVEVARQHKVHHIISFKRHRGLAAAFQVGIDNALRLGADILVNTDADQQYRGESIPDLVAPIINHEADMVVGARPLANHPEFSWLKRKLELLGTWVVQKFSGTTVQDAASGFRAYNRAAMMKTNVFSEFSYTMETLLQAGYRNLQVASVPIKINPKTRKSRLVKNMFHYLWKSGHTILKVFLIYKSVTTFSFLALCSFLSSVGLAGRFVYLVLYQGAPRNTFWPSIILAACLFILSIQLYLTGILAMLLGSNRKLMEETVFRLRRFDFDNKKKSGSKSDLDLAA